MKKKQVLALSVAAAMVMGLTPAAIMAGTAGSVNTEEYEITVNGVTGIASYEDVDSGDGATKSFVITFDGVDYAGKIDKGVWTAEDAAAQPIIEAYQAAHEADPSFQGAPPSSDGESADGESQEGGSAEGEAPAGEAAEQGGPGGPGGPGGEGESAEGESGSSGAAAGPTITASAEANPEQAITLDGIAMGQVQSLTTTASVIYEGGVLDEVHSTGEGISVDGKVTTLISDEDNANGIIIRNTGAFVLGGESDPALVAERLSFSFQSSEYSEWDDFCEALGLDSSLTLEEIAQKLVDEGSTSSYTNLGLEAPETVVLNDYVVEMNGAGSNDMGGFGAAVYVSDNADAQLNNFRIITRGPARGAVFTRFGATATINNSTIYAVSDPNLQTMQGCPPGLFIEGKVRATNAVGASIVNYNDSVVISQGWGALSTDSDDLYTNVETPTTLNISNSYIAVLTSGYGAYSDGAARDTFIASVIDVPDYGAVETGSGIVKYEDSIINAGEYAVMTHSANSRGEIVFKNVQIHVGEAGVMLRDTANTVLFENSTIAFDGTYEIDPELAAQYGVDIADVDAEFGTVNGVDENYVHTVFHTPASTCIVKLIHNSDPGSGTESTGAAPVVTIKDSEMTGDILNTAAMEGDENTATSGPAGEGIRTARSLDVTLDAAKVTGAISLGQDTWAFTYFASGSNTTQKIGYAESTELGQFHDEGFGLVLAVTNGSTWTVTRDSYLTSLTIDEASAIVGADGAAVVMSVNGVETEIAAGTYEGEIVISVK